MFQIKYFISSINADGDPLFTLYGAGFKTYYTKHKYVHTHMPNV